MVRSWLIALLQILYQIYHSPDDVSPRADSVLIVNIEPMAGNDPVVDTVYGPVRGSDDGRVKVWKGVRYAAAADR